MNENKNISGILLVNKPEGWTSFDVVAKLRGILGIKRLGHAGTLDPMATGVLPIFAGKATRACDILPEDEKSYLAGFQLGVTTDTQDSTGEVLCENSMPIETGQLIKVTSEFQGDILQIPPMYSAVSVGGKRLYQLAREGKTVERQPRKRRVNRIEIREYDESKRQGILWASVSKGTYIRTLINDIGERLGCGGVMTSLTRTSAAGFCIEQCLSLEEIQGYADENRLDEIIMPIEKLFDGAYEKIMFNRHCTPLYKNGVKLRLEQAGITDSAENDGRIFCVYGYDGEFLGLGQAIADKNRLRIYKNFF